MALSQTFAASLTLSDACRAVDTPLIIASALGLQGYVAGFCGTAPSFRAIFPELPASAPTCATAGILGPVVATMGTLQAQMAL
jgi:molybdopterin/thiamine biosynthesis adenylyltransferase